MALFSGSVKITDLNDYIAPSQSCVVSLKGTQLDDAAKVCAGSAWPCRNGLSAANAALHCL